MSECCFLFPQCGRVVILVMIMINSDFRKANKPVKCKIYFLYHTKKGLAKDKVQDLILSSQKTPKQSLASRNFCDLNFTGLFK